VDLPAAETLVSALSLAIKLMAMSSNSSLSPRLDEPGAPFAPEVTGRDEAASEIELAAGTMTGLRSLLSR
jgi:hypothetical protein